MEASQNSVSIHFCAVFTNDSKNDVFATVSHWLREQPNLNLNWLAPYSHEVGSMKHKLITCAQDQNYSSVDQEDGKDTCNSNALLWLEEGLMASLKWYSELCAISGSIVDVDMFQRILNRSFGDGMEFVKEFKVRLPIKFWEELDYFYFDSKDIRVLLFAYRRPFVFRGEASWRFYSLEIDVAIDKPSDIQDFVRWRLYASFPCHLAENLSDAVKMLEAMMRAKKVQWNEKLDSYREEIERENTQEADELDSEEENNSWYGESLSCKLDRFNSAMDEYRYQWYFPVVLIKGEDGFIHKSPLPSLSDVLKIPCSKLLIDDFYDFFEGADGQEF